MTPDAPGQPNVPRGTPSLVDPPPEQRPHGSRGEPKVGRNGGLDAIRLAAALLVFLSHAAVATGSSFDATIVRAGPLGVTLFFALSGYLIPKVYAQGRGYAPRRLARILPGYWFAVLGLGLLGASLSPAHFAMLQARPDVSGDGVSGVVWTLRVELVFYALVPLLARLPAWAIVIGSAASLLGLWANPDSELFAFHLWRFLPGLLVYRLAPKSLPWSVGLLGLSLLGLEWLWPTGQELGSIAAGLLVAVAVSRSIAVPRWVVFGSTISYGLYLWHQAILWHLRALPPLELVGIGAAATIAIATLSWFVVEQPAIRLAAGRRSGDAQREVAALVVPERAEARGS